MLQKKKKKILAQLTIVERLGQREWEPDS